MKAWGMGGLFIIGIFGAFGASASENKISQDDISLDLRSGEVRFNDQVVDLEQLKQCVSESYSISFSAWDSSDDAVDDLFGEAPATKSAHLPGFPVKRLIDALEPIEAAGVDPKLVRLHMFMSVDKKPVGRSLVIGPGEELLLYKTPMTLAELSSLVRGPVTLGMKRENGEQVVDYLRFLEVARALHSDVRITALYCDDRSQVEVSAKVYTLKDDGSKQVLTAPKLTTKAGNAALLRVVENGSGMTSFASDEFHQEDLGNLGVRLSVEPRIIGEDIMLSGVVIIAKSLGKEEAFRDGDIPIYSYSSKKVVVPFSTTFSPGESSVEFKATDMEDEPLMCLLSAEVVDDRGMSRADHEKARAAAKLK